MVSSEYTVFSSATEFVNFNVFSNGAVTTAEETPAPEPQALGDPFSTNAPIYTPDSGHALTPSATLLSGISAPYPTNTWWNNLYLNTNSDRIKVHPYTVRVDSTDLNIDLPNSLSNSSTGVAEAFNETVRVQVTETIASRRITAFDDLSVTNRWEVDSTHYMYTPLVKGSPYVSIYINDLTPLLSTTHAILTVNGSGFSGDFTNTKFKVTFNNSTTWIFYFDSSVTLTASSAGGYKLTAGSTYTGWLRVAKLADSGHETDLDTYATKIPTGGSASVSVTGDTATITYTYVTTGTGTLLCGVLPHHQDMLTAPSYATPQWTTIKGVLKTIAGSSLTFTQALTTITWKAPRDIDSDKLSAVQSALASDYTTTVNPTDPYFGGKLVAKLGKLALIADELGDTSKASTIRTNLESAMAEWIPSGGDETPIYESKWGGICTPSSITDSNADFGHGYYNDHHFHWGYWVYAAYCLGKENSTWLSTYQQHVTDLCRDIANPSWDDPYFTKNRHFDWYDMHSWAAGLFSFGDGRNQESTSEAINAYYSVYLWGSLIGNDNMRNFARTLLGLEMRSTKKYWQINDSEGIYGTPYADNHVVGVLWETKVDYSTFFGGDDEFIHGIQLIPITPICEDYFDPTWIEQQYPFVVPLTFGRTWPTGVPNVGIQITSGGTGYLGTSSSYSGHTVANNVQVTGGTGSGLTINMNIRNSDGAIVEVFRQSRGSGYTDGDVVTPLINTGGLANQGSGASFTLSTVVPEGWKNFLYGEHAVIDKATAWTEVQSLTGYDDGNTETNMLYWVATRP